MTFILRRPKVRCYNNDYFFFGGGEKRKSIDAVFILFGGVPIRYIMKPILVLARAPVYSVQLRIQTYTEPVPLMCKNRHKISQDIRTFLRCMLLCVQLESNGDPWKHYPDVDPNSVRYFWEYFYFVLVMLTTIGFGDIYPNTILGKLFLVFYVLICLVRRPTSVIYMCLVSARLGVTSV